jgi:hypothetical protein
MKKQPSLTRDRTLCFIIMYFQTNLTAHTRQKDSRHISVGPPFETGGLAKKQQTMTEHSVAQTEGADIKTDISHPTHILFW